MISLKYTSASRKRVTHTEQMKLRDKQKKSNQHVWVDGFLLARKFCERTPLKPSKSVQNPSKALKTLRTGPYTGRGARFLQTAQISLKNTPALRARGLHTRSRWSFVIRDRLCRRRTMSSNVFKRARGKPSTQTCWFDFVPYHGASSAPCV